MSACVHHWRLEEPNGSPIVLGVCRHCEASREFVVSSESGPWRDLATRSYREQRRRNERGRFAS